MKGECGPNGTRDCNVAFNAIYGAVGMAMQCRSDSFPWLEELDISGSLYYCNTLQYPQLSNLIVTDGGMEKLSVKLLALRKIDVSGNDGCSDRSLIALSSHCVLLEEIACRSCFVTEDGVCFVLHHSPNLVSLTAGEFFPSPDLSSTFGNSLIYARALRIFDLYDHEDVDGFLSSIVKAGVLCPNLFYTAFTISSKDHLHLFVILACHLDHLLLYQLFNLIVESMEGNVCKELPEECWESILNQLALDHGYNALQVPSVRLYAEPFKDFETLKELEICDPSSGVVVDKIMDIDYIISRITSSGFDLQSHGFTRLREPPSKESFLKLGSTMRNLKILRCREFFSLRDPEIVATADSFPWLEELDISGSAYYRDTVQYPQLSNLIVTDAGMEKLSVKLLALRKIDVSRNGGCSDRSLIALSSHCVLLEEIACRSCFVTEDGVCFVLHHSPNLVSLTAGEFFPSPDLSSIFGNSLIYARALRVLDLYDHGDVDGLLSSVVKVGIPLEKPRIETNSEYREEDYGFCLHGLSTFLPACPSLKHLEVWYVYFLNDHAVRDLCRYLSNIVSIKLWDCKNLTFSTFFILAKECPMPSEIELIPMSKVGDEFVTDLERNDCLTSVILCSNWCLTDELLKKVGVLCPNLHTLHVRGCGLLTQEGIGQALKCCSQMKHLTIIQFKGNDVLGSLALGFSGCSRGSKWQFLGCFGTRECDEIKHCGLSVTSAPGGFGYRPWQVVP
ncbi:hypothetical protein RHSIM_RhsimUnG0035500 [Rhododendron simsii]|uniref:F-box/LRR-repeat protein 15-like leucin rich repeat domain-containing protein n=1 Tax=Rhododendron simsii TaxID=118357 RepID=A0A834FWL7_RHOSS|nr:hypothetical protein RHSIM_RhsimUnG0035500 [Rhododendron simsii]